MNTKIFLALENLIKTSPQILRDENLLRQAISGEFDVFVNDVSFDHIGQLVDKIDSEVLERYFSKVWQPETKKFKYSGLTLIDEINSLGPSSVIDLGCGYNEFKGKIHNLIGIDAYNDKADIKCSILDFKPTQLYDAVIILGSINFGSTNKIFAELEKAVSLTSPGGRMYFRVNPGLSHDKPESKWIDFYDWTPNFIVNMASYFGVELVTLQNDSNNRFYFVWKKKD